LSKQTTNRRTGKKYKPGDRVTWGNGSIVCTVRRVVADGVIVWDPSIEREHHVRFKWTAYRETYELRRI